MSNWTLDDRDEHGDPYPNPLRGSKPLGSDPAEWVVLFLVVIAALWVLAMGMGSLLPGGMPLQ